MRPLAPPLVVAPPTGARVRTRLRVDEHDAEVLFAVGRHLGTLANRDLAAYCTARAKGDDEGTSRTRRKQALTAASSSR